MRHKRQDTWNAGRKQVGPPACGAGRLQLPDRGAMSFTREAVARCDHCGDNIPAPAQRQDRTVIGACKPAVQSFGFAPHSLQSGTSQDRLWSPFGCEFDTGGAQCIVVWRARSGRYVSPFLVNPMWFGVSWQRRVGRHLGLQVPRQRSEKATLTISQSWVSIAVRPDSQRKSSSVALALSDHWPAFPQSCASSQKQPAFGTTLMGKSSVPQHPLSS